jgi:hypothetical protein
MWNIPDIQACAAEPVVTADEREHPTLALLTWSPALSMWWALQIYVNGELFDVVTRAGVDRCLLRLDRGEQHLIELHPVDAREPWQERPAGVSGFDDPPTCGLRLDMPRDPEALDPTLRIGLRVEDELALIAPIWPANAARPGFGVRFGEEDFGYSFAVGPGFGATEAGEGPFGCGGTRLRHVLDLPPGQTHEIEAVLIDRAGVAGPVIATARVELYAVSPPAGPIDVAGGFTLTWTLPGA